ncbi:replication initiation protein [Paraburkholderia sp. RL18-103-BIB-C]|uniref:replication initiation protein n=1 Tax=Paraburkholderia sp. RL18-103-BIB-C TaxID=3031637 RepID=UPI0038BB0D35
MFNENTWITMVKSKNASTDEGQIQLFAVPQSAEPFRKAVQAIHISPKKGAIALQQLRIWNGLIKNAIEQHTIEQKTTGKDRDEFSIQLQDLMRQVGMANSNNRDYIKDTCRSLVGTVVDWDYLDEKSSKLWSATGLLAGVTIEGSTLHYQFSKQLREALMNPAVYATLDMRLLRLFRRGHSVTLWEQVVRFKKVGRTKRFPVDTLREMFVGQDSHKSSYAEYKILKRAVLLPALKEINELSELDVTMEEFREGRSVSAVQFLMVPKPNAIAQADIDLELLADVAKLGIPNSEARNVISAHGDADVRKALNLVNDRIAKKNLAPVTNVPAYFRKALVSGWTAPEPVSVERNNANSTPKQKDPEPAATASEIRARIIAGRVPEAKTYFVGLDTSDQTVLVNDYNAQQSIRKWQVSTTKPPNEGAEKTFYNWLARRTWGEPTEEDIVAFLLRSRKL